MIALEAGHIYSLQSLDGGDHEVLRFVKREGEGYPGNKGSHPGTIIQEVLRACIDRLDYVNKQIPCSENRRTKWHLQEAILCLEKRAAKRHERPGPTGSNGIEFRAVCAGCGHIGCDGCRGH